MFINIQDDILKLHALGLLDRLLQDKATKGNILWATDAYADLGEWYSPGNEIRPQRITGEWSDLIKTRARRAMEQRTERTRQHAEVFTPLWIVKKMNDFADEQWFKRKSGIYKLTDEGKIYFSKDKHWKLYVDARRMEITCGEAPFLVTRYDVETGEAIPIEDRIGLLDRKLRAVTENTQDIEEWKTWALRAVQAIYGYELQGDNLLIARVNILCSVEEHMFHRWRQRPDKAWLEKLCNVISWNLWQMDGIKGCVPVPPKPTEEQLSLFPPIEKQFFQVNLFGESEEKDIFCRLFDWRGDRSIDYTTLRKEGSKLMKFDFIIGNPPYMETTQDTSDNPIYHFFMEEAYSLGDTVELITPARFLFDAGKTPKAWNQKMLHDPHLKTLWYESVSGKVFPNISIMGGVVVTLRENNREIGPIEVFTTSNMLNSILSKVRGKNAKTIDTWIYSPESYKFSKKIYIDHPELLQMTFTSKGKEVPLISKGHDYALTSNIFEKLKGILFFDSPQDNNSQYRVFGKDGSERKYLYLRADYLEDHDNLRKFKVFLPKSNGAPAVGSGVKTPVIGSPEIGPPLTGHTQTFISIGALETETEAAALIKYIKTKFVRVLVGVLKVTQDNKKGVWKFVPLQDFTEASDIDWSKTIPEIDQQLYAKYGLDEKEIAFIESHVKEMS